MRQLLLLTGLSLVVPFTPSHGQTSTAASRIADAIRHEETIRVRRGYSVIAVKGPSIVGDALVGTVQTGDFMGSPTFDRQTIPLGTVDELIARRGTWALEGLAIGALGGLLVVATIHQLCQRDAQATGGQCETAIPIGQVYALGVGGFGLLGLVGGALKPKWRTIYSRGTPTVPDPYVGYAPGRGQILLGLRVAH